ncbi:hypothetical protein MXD61_26775 [Frankia sp. AgPm24]|uniref:hypothetical protein n=1 Tax=Frankia sp. AgPm24 TaxID=631128 RepID=UPI00200D2D46|nr:hypothetical protein [Frankia sp. AgPm24]MCK9925434.1 hypothetical protein [Frankia sp. AgPm24]
MTRATGRTSRRVVRACDPVGSFRRRVGLALAARIASDMPDIDRDTVHAIVTRTVDLLAGPAVHRSVTLSDPMLYLMARALRDPTTHQVVAGLRLDLPDLPDLAGPDDS